MTKNIEKESLKNFRDTYTQYYWAVKRTLKKRNKEVKDLNAALRYYVRKCRRMEGKPENASVEVKLINIYKAIQKGKDSKEYKDLIDYHMETYIKLLKPENYIWFACEIIRRPKYLVDIMYILDNMELPDELQQCIKEWQN